MKPINITIVGAGGVSSYLLPQLIRAFKINRLTIYDEDILEEQNLERQLFNEKYIGENKAAALCDTLYIDSWVGELKVVEEWFTNGCCLPKDEHVIISAADNHAARRAVLESVDCAAYSTFETDANKSPFAIVAGNDYFDSESYAYFNMWKGTVLDPRIKFPEIQTSMRGDPTSCQGVAQVSDPQLALANARAASHTAHLLYVWWNNYLGNFDICNEEDRRTIYRNLPCYLRTSETRTECLNLKSILYETRSSNKIRSY